MDNLPFLTVELFELMVNTMPNLEAVTITRCVMLDVTKLRPLLDIIKCHPRTPQSSTPGPSASSSGPALKACNQKKCAAMQAEPKKSVRKYISLDFAPFFFRGSYSDRRGCYGVTHNEPTFHTPKAVFALILQCWRLAQEVEMDLVSDSSSFWSFVRQLPGPDALWAIKAREALLTREFDLAAKGPKTPSDSILDKFADDLTAALTGDNHKHANIPLKMARYLPRDQQRKGRYWRRSVDCPVCRTSLPLSLFPVRADACWSCKMALYVLSMEDSHLRLWMESAMKKWLSGMKTKTDRLPKLLRQNDSLAETLEDVQCADWVREHYLFSWKPPQVPDPDPDSGWITTPPPSYCPPVPETLGEARVSLARWRGRQEPTQVFDYRHGGPQREDACKLPILSSDKSVNAEAIENFKKRWQWSLKTDERFRELWNEEFDRKFKRLPEHWRPPTNNNREEELDTALSHARVTRAVREKMIAEEYLLEGEVDQKTYLRRHHHVEDCLFSLGTPGKVPFCKDQPIPDPGVDRNAYDALAEKKSWNSSGYGHVPNGYW